jgi:hypothetical protein
MASLDSLPTELLIEVLDQVHQSSQSSNNLFNALLVARKYYNVAKDILYRAPRLSQPLIKDRLNWNEENAHHLRGLLKTILDKPQLAKQIYELDLTVIQKEHNNKPILQPGTLERIDQFNHYHWPTWEYCETLLDNIYAKRIDSRLRENLKVAWESHVNVGFEPATASLILALTPSLEHQSLNTFCKHDYSSCQIPEYTSPKSFRPFPISAKDWFSEGSLYNPSAITGLENVVSIKCNDVIPWSMMSKPAMSSLQIRYSQSFSPEEMNFPPAGSYVSSNVTSLTMHTDCQVITGQEQGMCLIDRTCISQTSLDV